jgi:hypothetical protein
VSDPHQQPVDGDDVAEQAASADDRPSRAIGRRLLAAIIDALTVAVPTAVLSVLIAERFTVLGQSDGRPVFSEVDQRRIDQIDEGFNRALRIGDALFTLSGPRWWLAVAVLLAMTGVVFVIIPGRAGGRTIGKQLTGLAGSAGHDDGPEMLHLEQILSEFGVTAATNTDKQDAYEPDDGPATSNPPIPDVLAGPTAVEPDIDTQGPNESEGDEQRSGMDYLDDALSDEPTPHDDASGQIPDIASDLASLGGSDDYRHWDPPGPGTENGPRDLSSSTGGFGDLALSESSLAESPLTASVVTDRQTLPEWNEAWEAWTYRDPNSGRLFRHDTERDRWEPIS